MQSLSANLEHPEGRASLLSAKSKQSKQSRELRGRIGSLD